MLGAKMATEKPLDISEMDFECLGTVGIYAKKYFALRKKCEQIQQVRLRWAIIELFQMCMAPGHVVDRPTRKIMHYTLLTA